MKKRVLGVVLTLVLALGCAFAVMGCGSDAKDLYDFTKSTSTPYSSATKIDELDKYAYGNSAEGNLAVFYNYDSESSSTSYKVFNLDTGKVVATMTIAEGAVGGYYLYEVEKVGGAVFCSYYKAANASVYTYKLFNENGTEITNYSKSGDLENNILEINLDLIEFNDIIYRVGTDGSVVKAFDVNDLSKFEITGLDAKSENYYYAAKEGVIVVYSAVDGTPVSYYQKPSYAEDFSWYVLSNGNIFVQYSVKVDPYTDKYDYLKDNQYGQYGIAKYTLEQKIVNPKNGDVKDVKNSKNPVYIEHVVALSGVIAQNYTFTTDGYKGSAKNFASVLKIEDKKINTYTHYNYFMSDKGKLSEIEDTIVAQEGVGEFLDNGYVILTSKLGQKFLYDAELNLVGEVTNAQSQYYTEKFIITDKAIYDYTLKKVIDFAIGGYDISYYSKVGENIIVRKEVKTENSSYYDYYLLKDSNTPTLIGTTNSTDAVRYVKIIDKCIVTRSAEGKYSLCNEDGTVLASNLESTPYSVLDAIVKTGNSYYFVK